MPKYFLWLLAIVYFTGCKFLDEFDRQEEVIDRLIDEGRQNIDLKPDTLLVVAESLSEYASPKASVAADFFCLVFEADYLAKGQVDNRAFSIYKRLKNSTIDRKIDFLFFLDYRYLVSSNFDILYLFGKLKDLDYLQDPENRFYFDFFALFSLSSSDIMEDSKKILDLRQFIYTYKAKDHTYLYQLILSRYCEVLIKSNLLDSRLEEILEFCKQSGYKRIKANTYYKEALIAYNKNDTTDLSRAFAIIENILAESRYQKELNDYRIKFGRLYFKRQNYEMASAFYYGSNHDSEEGALLDLYVLELCLATKGKNDEHVPQLFENLLVSERLSYIQFSNVLIRMARWLKDVGEIEQSNIMKMKYLELASDYQKVSSSFNSNDVTVKDLWKQSIAENKIQKLKNEQEVNQAFLNNQITIFICFIIICIFLTILVWLWWLSNSNLRRLKLREEKLIVTNNEMQSVNQLANIQNEHKMVVLNELKNVNLSLNGFAMKASNQIQDPLKDIRTNALILFEKYNHKVSEEDREFFDFILSSCKDLQEIVTGLLQFSTVSQMENTEPKNIDLNKILDKVSDLIQVQLKEKNGLISYANELPKCLGFNSLIEQLFLNLVNNAIKFSKPDVEPVIRIEAIEKEGWVEVAVIDNGIGIDPMFHSRIFQFFRRLSNKSLGSGIGLATCQKIAELHGGKIWVESELGEGATFYFLLPQRKDQLELPI